MADGVLAREVVELVTRGLAKVNKDIDSVRQRLGGVDREAKKAAEGIGGIGKLAAVAFASATAAGVIGVRMLTQMVRKGFEGTEQGERLSKAWDRIGESLATALIPLVERLSAALETIAPVMEQVAQVAANVFDRVAEQVEKSIGRISEVLQAMGKLAAFGGLGVALGREGLAGKGAEAGFRAATEPKKFELKKLGEKEPERGFEKVEDTFKRVQLAALKESDKEKQARLLEEANQQRAMLIEILRNATGGAIAGLIPPGFIP